MSNILREVALAKFTLTLKCGSQKKKKQKKNHSVFNVSMSYSQTQFQKPQILP